MKQLVTPALASELHEDSQHALDAGVRNKCWVFLHLERNGGTTIKKILYRRWKIAYDFYDNDQWQGGDVIAAKYAERLLVDRQLRVIAGEHAEGLRSMVGDRCKWFTVFRHPVSQLVSAYFYCKQRPHKLGCAYEHSDKREEDLVMFAKHRGNLSFQQFMLNYVTFSELIDDAVEASSVEEFGGLQTGPGWNILKRYLKRLPKAAVRDMLPPMKKVLHNNYTAVGILEQFDETLELFNRALEMPNLEWKKWFHNSNIQMKNLQYHIQEHELLTDPLIYSKVKKYIELDLSLYEHAVTTFNHQKEVYGI